LFVATTSSKQRILVIPQAMKIGPIMSASTVVVGLNAALQKRFVMLNHSLIPGNVHRATHISTGVGGKGQDVACTLHCLEYYKDAGASSSDSIPQRQKLAQFIGRSPEGDQVYNMLSDMLGKDAVHPTTVRTASSMRTCTSIVAADSTTELVEPSGVVAADELQELLTTLQESVTASALCIMGSMPPGCGDDTYAAIYKAVTSTVDESQQTLCLIDSVAGLDPLLRTVTGPTILKVNASELCRLVGMASKSISEAAGVPCEQVVEAVTAFMKQYHATTASAPVTAIALTDGKHPAYMALVTTTTDAFQLYRLPIATLPENTVVYPIGAGDSVAAGTLAAWNYLHCKDADCLPTEIQTALEQRGDDSVYLTAFAFGLACGSASCLQEENSVVQIPDVLRLFTNTGRPTFVSSHTLYSSSY
jgi:fructose-1-phosphate kinase PfkB-like protein